MCEVQTDYLCISECFPYLHTLRSESIAEFLGVSGHAAVINSFMFRFSTVDLNELDWPQALQANSMLKFM